ncbi:MAG TPA: DUF3854 domain-containing protein [Thermodesulfobacteriota bacterium]
MAVATLFEPHRADCHASGLSDETIARADLFSVPPGDLNRLCGREIPAGHSGLGFPYERGARPFTRVKLFPALRTGDGRQVKYLQPANSPVRAYLRGLDLCGDRETILADPSVSLRITEGEKKALALCQAKLPTIGLGGIWNFRAKTLPPDQLIADLEVVEWARRLVYLVPDSDAWANEHVLDAVFRLARLLEARRATVSVVQIPEGGR